MSVLKLSLCVFFISILFLSCGKKARDVSAQSGSSHNSADATAIEFTDALNRKVTVTQANKVAVLQGSLAHIWLCAGGKLAATTADTFTEADELSFNKDALSDAENLGALMSPNVELLIGGGYDFIILSSAMSAHTKLQSTLEAAGFTIAYFKVETFSDYLSMMQICTHITGDEEAYKTNALAVSQKIDELKATFNEKPSVLVLRTSSGKITSRSARNDMSAAMLSDLGCVNIADEKQSLLEDVSLEKIIEADPDFIFVTMMGADSAKALSHLESTFAANPAWASLSAVKSGHYIILPRELFHFKPCEKWADSYAFLISTLLS